MRAMASQITGVSRVCWTLCSGADQRKHQSSASPAFVRGIHRWPEVSHQKGPATRKIPQFHGIIMWVTNDNLKQPWLGSPTHKYVIRLQWVKETLGRQRLSWKHFIKTTGAIQENTTRTAPSLYSIAWRIIFRQCLHNLFAFDKDWTWLTIAI